MGFVRLCLHLFFPLSVAVASVTSRTSYVMIKRKGMDSVEGTKRVTIFYALYKNIFVFST
jgi:hypothetical protein